MFTVRGNSTVLSNLVEWLVAFEETFIAPGKDIEEGAIHLEKQRLRGVSAAARKHLAAFVEELGGAYLERVRELLDMELTGGCDFEVLIKTLSAFGKGANTFAEVVPESTVDFVGVATSCVRQLCRICGDNLHKGFAAQVEGLVFEEDSPLDKQSHTLSLWIDRECKRVLLQLQQLAKSDVVVGNTFFDGEYQDRCVKAGVIQGFVAFVVDYTRGYAGTPTGKVDVKPLQSPAAQTHVGVPIVSLLLSHFCLELASSGIAKLVEMGSRYFSTGDRTDSDDADQLAVMQKSAEVRKTASALLARFVDGQAVQISELVRKAMSSKDWIVMPEPSIVSPDLLLVAHRIKDTFALAKQLYGNKLAEGASVSREQFMISRSTAMHDLFTERTEIFGAVEPRGRAITFAVIKHVLKAYSESVRFCTFGPSGFQQIEVDAHMLGRVVWKHASSDEERAFIQTVMQQVVASAKTRCTENPAHIDEASLQAIL